MKAILVAGLALILYGGWAILNKLGEIADSLKRIDAHVEEFTKLHMKVNGLKERAAEMDQRERDRYRTD